MSRPWSWCFRSQEALQQALENYGLFCAGPRVTRYGPSTFDLTEQSDEAARTQMCRMRIVSEIEGRMKALERKSPYLYKLLRRYYLVGPVWHMADGWVSVARRHGLPADAKSKWDKQLFERLVAEAVRVLFHLRTDSKIDRMD